jgi:hypothetical protein
VSQLSSGEQVILRFAISLFPFDRIRTGVLRPKLLLLDEMDASLHPEMVNRWLTAIREGLVETLGVSCILTTHSPTTVALAPEESLFELSLGRGGPSKVTRQQALNRLTYGVPTLSIDYEGRRQVFVESDTDARSYEMLASLLKGRIGLKRSLTFLATGMRNASAEINAGCTIVRKLVGELSAAGNKSVFGILDWDRVNEPDSRIVVVGHGSHYALDNLLLDPLLLGALLLRENGSLPGFEGTFASLTSADPMALQSLVKAVQHPIAYPGTDRTETQSDYVDGTRLDVRSIHMTMNGHELEELVIKTHPSLNRYHARNKGRGMLTGAVVQRVLSDFPGFCPMPLATAFMALANSEIE